MLTLSPGDGDLLAGPAPFYLRELGGRNGGGCSRPDVSEIADVTDRLFRPLIEILIGGRVRDFSLLAGDAFSRALREPGGGKVPAAVSLRSIRLLARWSDRRAAGIAVVYAAP